MPLAALCDGGNYQIIRVKMGEKQSIL